ncbi:MAG TPA: tRNA uridine-5-carboxymethylaminomethyl(34) synthesis GTPase MnmE [Rectinemataceae bacterium]|nr:tRNA uridine-5-carboxymethylaminomethyl(34) synthesis GTPase MnmE [Rectinemataceae bacterium]
MSRSYLDPPLPIVALATVAGKSALAVLRASGKGCLELLAPCFSRGEKLLAAPGHSLVHGHFVDPGDSEAIDEVLVAVFRAPASPTGEDQFEISCHGSPVIVRRILSVLETAGFSPALPGEFSFRAFANGKEDLVGAEAVDELVSAPGEAARAEALRRLGGGLSRRLEMARKTMLGLLAEAEVRLDYAEEDGSPSELFPAERLRSFRDKLSSLSASWSIGKLHSEGVRVVIAGSANAGKSSLFNLLVREERAIVSPEPGTTRDWIESGFELAGIPVRLVDTAGLREGTGTVEAIGMDRSRSLAAGADVVICLADATLGLGPADEELLARRADAIRAWNKVDRSDAAPAPRGWIALSALEGRGLPELLGALEVRLRELESRAGGLFGSGSDGRASGSTLPLARRGEAAIPSSSDTAVFDFVVASPRQKRLLDRAVASLEGTLAIVEAGPDAPILLDAAALELRDAADALGELTGEIASPEVLETIFSGFCLGK